MPTARPLVVFAGLIALFPLSVNAERIEWVRQLGTIKYDGSSGVSTDGGGYIYISGSTGGNLSGQNAGYQDAFVSKFSAAGNLLWTRQFGTTDDDFASGITADGLGNVYVTGITHGDLAGPTSGPVDSFIGKFDSTGLLLWSRQFGTHGDDSSRSISADGLGNVYISGDTDGSLAAPRVGIIDSFVSKYDGEGTLLWSRQFGTSFYAEDTRVSVDKLGNVFFAGYTNGEFAGPILGGLDGFVGKYDASGKLQWIRQLGTRDDDECKAISADGLGNVYVSGETNGSLSGPNVGKLDAFVSKYDASGNLLWTKQLGTTGDDISRAVSADGLGNVYISGETNGLSGGTLFDAFVGKYDANGNFLWLRRLDSAATEASFGIAADRQGNVYFSGSTDGNLGGSNAGRQDAFVAKISDSPVPEPSSSALVAISILAAFTARAVDAVKLNNVSVRPRHERSVRTRRFIQVSIKRD